MTYNAAERKDVRRAEKEAKIADRLRGEVLVGLMASSSGRAWVCDLLISCHVFASSFTGESLSSAYAEGERNIGLKLLADLMQYCPDSYPQMMRENNERDSARTNRNGRDQGSDLNGLIDDFDDEGRPIYTEADDIIRTY